MRSFHDDAGAAWTADAAEEDTPRHHGRWILVFRDGSGQAVHPMPEVRWQNRRTALRTIAAMSEFELRRRLLNVRGRLPRDAEAVREQGADAGRRAEVLRGAAHA
jgi:hypothetical protein